MKYRKFYTIILMGFFLISGCAQPASFSGTETPVSQAAVATSAESSPTAISTFTEPTAIPINHVVIPTEGITDRSVAHDNENILSFQTRKVKTGDDYVRNRFERPFTSIDMDYLPDVDILDYSINSDEEFLYMKISFVGVEPASQQLTGYYGIELDRDADGRAEILILVKPTYTDHFSADNVVLYLDLNGDVGGFRPNRPDDYQGNGYDALVFDLSQNVYPEDDPDLAWVRQTTHNKQPAVEIALRKWIFEGRKQAFMWNVISSDVPINPAKLYFHDNFTPEQAGAANTDDPNYPIKDLAGIDNTCRVPYGFEVTGKEPLACFIIGNEIVWDGEPDAPVTSVSAIDESQGCQRFPEICRRSANSIRINP